MIAAHHSMMGGAAWQNPYVTNGLVAMWDGEWNAGGGVHDANATVWKDLVKKNNMSCLIDSTCFFTASALRFDTAISAATLGYYLEGAVFFEIVARTQTENSQCVVVAFCPTYNALIYRHNNRGLTMTARVIGCANGFSYANNAAVHTISADYSDSYATSAKPPVYIDGEPKGNYSVGGAWMSDFSMPSGLKLGGMFTSDHGVVYVHNIRAYSRALTAAEIAANYAIDKERFGLS